MTDMSPVGGASAKSATEPVVLRPITDADVRDVAEFLHRTMNQRVPPDRWIAAMQAPWQRDPPNHGFLLRSGEQVVGAYIAMYSDREIDGHRVRFCNMAAWCVEEAYRFKGLRLAQALLKQDGFEFTDFSPSGNVIALNERLGFERLDTSTAVGLNVPWPTRRGSGRVVTEPAEIEAILRDPDLAIYCDHVGSSAVKHLVLQRGDDHCYVIVRRDRRKRLPLFATVLYVSNKGLFAEMHRQLERHLLLRGGFPAMLSESRITGHRPKLSVKLKTPRPKMFKSERLRAEQIDYLYSELTALAW